MRLRCSNTHKGLHTLSTLRRGRVLCVVLPTLFEKMVALWVFRKSPAALPVSEFLCVCVCFMCSWWWWWWWCCQETTISFLLINSVPGLAPCLPGSLSWPLLRGLPALVLPLARTPFRPAELGFVPAVGRHPAASGFACKCVSFAHLAPVGLRPLPN